MADVKSNCPTNSSAFKEAVCIDASRVYDSCCDRDCLEDLRVYFCPAEREIVNSAISVRIRNAEVIDVNIDVDAVTFNKGFYSCDLTFFFKITLDVYDAPKTCPQTVTGIAYFNKKAILYGSEGSVKTFSNDYIVDNNCQRQTLESSNMPKCVVQCVDPIALSSRICEARNTYFDCPSVIPASVMNCLGGTFDTSTCLSSPAIYVTLGLFTIVQLVRNVQMLVPVYDFCIPEKQCNDFTDQPCDVFKKICFPTSDFFPPRPCDISGGCGCGSGSDDD